MNRDAHRERLLAKLYSREGAAEPARDYRDPLTGKVLHMTPTEWELLQYDREHPVQDAQDAQGAHGVQRAQRVQSAHESQAPDGGAASTHRASPVADGQTGAQPRRRRRIATGAALVVAGCIIGAGITLAVVLASPALVGQQQAASAPTNEIRNVFDSGDFASSDPGSLAAIGFERDSFRLVGDEIVYDRTGQVYAARRDDGQYCLVLVAGPVRVADACATAEGIGRDGLSLQDTTRESDGSLLTFTAEWNRDGQITWKLVESPH
jgi:hypothetical protein